MRCLPAILLISALLADLSCGDGSASIQSDDTGSTFDDTTSDMDATATTDTGQTTSDATAPLDAPPTPEGWSSLPVGRREVDDVCFAWADSAPGAEPLTTPGAETCEPPTLSPEARADALIRLNFYRWLVGLDLAAEDTSALNGVQMCAFYHASNGIGVSHDPDPSLPCYTSTVSEIASLSNLASGTATPSEAIDLFTTNVGHRALIIAPGLAGTAVGFDSGVTCNLIFGDAWSWSPPVHRTVAFPAPGPNPQDPTRIFTAHPATGHRFDETTAANISIDGEAAPIIVSRVQTGYGETILVMELESEPARDTDVEVNITGIDTDAGRVAETYTVRFVACPGG